MGAGLLTSHSVLDWAGVQKDILLSENGISASFFFIKTELATTI